MITVSATVPMAVVSRSVSKRHHREMDRDNNSFELGLTTRRARLEHSTEEESVSVSVGSNELMSVNDSIDEKATEATLMEVETPRVDKRK